MGAGASTTSYEISESDKAIIGRTILQFKADNAECKDMTEAEVFSKFMESLQKEKEKMITPVTSSIKLKQSASEPVLPSDMIKNSEYEDYDVDDEQDDEEDDVNDLTPNLKMKVNTRFKEENAFLRVRTSSEMLEQALTTVDENQSRITSFIEGLKTGDVRQTRNQGGIRERRLTSGVAIEESPKLSRKSTLKAAKSSHGARTTIFASSEIGVRQEKQAPFSEQLMGTFSCHGFEPSDDSIDGIQQKINQDRGCIAYPFNSRPTEALFLVLDGHGAEGDRVAEFAMRQIVVTLEKHPQLAADPVKALEESFIHTNTALMVTPIKYMTSGSTVVAVYVVGNTFYVANVGDSRAVLAVAKRTEAVPGDESDPASASSEECTAVMLSTDHKPDCPEEMKRITQWGGFVSPSPEPGVTARVWLDSAYSLIGLAMSRSIGDHAVKNVGVTPEPTIYKHELTPDDKFLILASDGVWEFMENQEAVDIVRSNLHLGAYVACQILIQTAAKRWSIEEGDYRDDITAIVIVLPLQFQMTENTA